MNIRKVLIKMHLWLSIPLGIFFSLLCITGAILVYRTNYTEWVNANKYFAKELKDSPLSLVSIVEKASAQLPDTLSLGDVSISTNPKKNYSFSVKELRRGAIYVNPYTGSVRGSQLSYQADFMNTVMRLHRWLLMPMKRGEFNLGRFITGWTTLLSVFILITGIIIWLPRKASQIKNLLKIRRKKGAFRFWYDFHLLSGICTALVLIPLCLTGLTWSFPWYKTAFYASFGAPIEQHSAAPNKNARQESYKQENTEDSTQKYLIWQSVVDELKASCPNAETIQMSDGLARVINKGRSFRQADKYTFNKQTGEITQAELYSQTATRQQKVQQWIMDIHFGTWAGWFSKLITFIAALIGASIPITGYYVWIKKKILKAQKAK